MLETFAKTFENLKESAQITEDRIEEVSKKIISEKNEILRFDIIKIQQLSNPKAYLYQLLKKYHFTEWNDIYNLLSAQSGKQIISETHRLLKDRDFLLLSKRDFSTSPKITFKIEKNTLEITETRHLSFKRVNEKSIGNKQIIYVSKELLEFPLIVRKWGNGDYFYPAGMQGKKKLSKYFKDEKLSLLEKEQTWLLCNAKNEIIWVIGKRQDNRFLVQDTSKEIVKVSII